MPALPGSSGFSMWDPQSSSPPQPQGRSRGNLLLWFNPFLGGKLTLFQLKAGHLPAPSRPRLPKASDSTLGCCRIGNRSVHVHLHVGTASALLQITPHTPLLPFQSHCKGFFLFSFLKLSPSSSLLEIPLKFLFTSFRSPSRFRHFPGSVVDELLFQLPTPPPFSAYFSTLSAPSGHSGHQQLFGHLMKQSSLQHLCASVGSWLLQPLPEPSASTRASLHQRASRRP